MVQAVFFDLGGTLFEHLEATTSNQNLQVAWQELLLELPEVASVRGRPDAIEQFVADYRQLRAQRELDLVDMPFYLHRSLVAQSFVSAASAQFSSEHCSPVILERHAEKFCDAQRNSVVQELKPRDDMRFTLDSLREMSLTLGIVSNIDEDYLVPLVRKHGLDKYFKFILSSERAQSCKPAPDIFLQALAEGGQGLQPPQVLFVGDSAPHDIMGAKSVGMLSCYIDLNRNREQKLPSTCVETDADFCIHELAQLTQVVRSL